MKLFLDTEFNGFGGELISIALVPEDPAMPEFYKELEIKCQLEPWVRDNVAPHLVLAPCTHHEMQQALADYLWNTGASEITIVADWPDDIRYFCQALITGPGMMVTLLNHITFDLDLHINYTSQVPHNALHDARAIRDYFVKP